MRKNILTFLAVIVIIISLLGFTYSYETTDNDVIKFTLIGPATLYLEVNSKYEENGIICKYGNVDVSDQVDIDYTNINMSKVGDYKIKYSYYVNDKEEYIYRKVKVIDTTKPVITLNGDYETAVLIYGTYIESGFEANDNYDGNITDNVKVEGGVDTRKTGKYKLTYTVTDSSNNTTVVTRTVVVKKPEITIEDYESNIVTASSYNVYKYSNTIIKNYFIDDGVYIEGYVKEDSDTFKLRLKNVANKDEYLFNLDKLRGNYYGGDLNLNLLPYGTYDVYIIGKSEEKLQNRLSNLSRIVRSRIGDKLITFVYEDGTVKLLVEKFVYQYDFVIDPGHGGTESGAANGVIEEKNMNLIQSLYEKCRYESMGYKVYMTRYKDGGAELLGNDNMLELQRRALTIGYYGSVSRVTYSNHHNAVNNTSARGFEILVSNNATGEILKLNKELYNKYLKFYGLEESSRIYSRDLDTGGIYDKTNNQVYPYDDYYAVIRIPRQLFNVYVTIYEPIYISNPIEFNWYWINKKVIDTTEIKIESYVNYLGGKYDKDNSSCLNILK